ncbi:hypothetical protein MASR2M39_16430 [Ignavibacteriales bacterium]
MKILNTALALIILISTQVFSQVPTPKEIFEVYKQENLEELKKISGEAGEKIDTDISLYIKALLTTDGEKSAAFLELLIQRYPRSEFTVAAYAGLYLYYLATENFRKANNCVFAVENEFPGADFEYFLDDLISTAEPDEPIQQP